LPGGAGRHGAGSAGELGGLGEGGWLAGVEPGGGDLHPSGVVWAQDAQVAAGQIDEINRLGGDVYAGYIDAQGVVLLQVTLLGEAFAAGDGEADLTFGKGGGGGVQDAGQSEGAQGGEGLEGGLYFHDGFGWDGSRH